MDPSKKGNLSISGNFLATSGNDLVHDLVLGIVEAQRKLNHWVCGLLEALSVRKEKVSDHGLLRVDNISENRWVGGLDLTTVHAADVSGGGASRSAASSRLSTSTAVDNTNIAILVNTYVRSVNDQATAAIRNVVGESC